MSTNAATDTPTRASKNLILAISTTTAFILPFLVASVNVALPTMGRELNMEAVVMTWVSTSYFLAIGVIQVPFGRLADILGRRRIFILGLVLSALGSFLGGLANSVTVLLISRVLQGFGSGMTFNVSVAILSSVFPGKERARALGISQSGTYLGLSLGPLFGGFLTTHLGWKSIFLISGGLGVLLVLLVFYGLRSEWQDARGEKFDVTGTIFYVIGIAAFMYGFSSLPSTTGIILTVVGVAALALFVWWESRTTSPIFNIALFRSNFIFIFCNIAAFITYLATFAINYLLSLYLQYIKGLDPSMSGLVLICASVLMTAFTIIAGFLAQKIESRILASFGMAIDLVATVMLIFLTDTTPLWYVILALMIYGTGIGLFVSPNTNAIMGSVDKKVLGVASGTLGTMRTVGMMLSMAIMMVIFSVYIGQAEITPEYYPQFLTSVRVGFIIFSVFGLGGVIAQAVARNRDKKSTATP